MDRYPGNLMAVKRGLPVKVYRWFILIASLSSFLIQGCTGPQVKQHAFDEYLDAGVAVAANSGGPRFNGDLFRYEELVTLQQDPEQPESFLYQSRSFLRTVKGFFMCEEGRFYVNDSGGARIAVFDAAGRFERSIGRRGQGPGEFMINELFELTDGVLKVYDHNLHRTTHYRTDGALVEMVHERGFRNADPNVLVTLTGPSHYDEEGHLWTSAGFVAMTAEMDTFGTAATREIKIKYEFPTPGRGKGGKSRPDVPFIARPFTKYLPDGSVLLTDGVEPVLWWHWLDGSIRKRIDLGISPRSVTRQDIDRFYHDLDEQFAAADENQRIYLGWLRNAVIFPEYRTLWNHIYVDDAGYIWLEGFEMDFERWDRGGGFTYYVLNPEGEYLGTTRAPAVGLVTRGHFMGELYDRETDREDYAVWSLAPRPEGFIYP